MDDRDESKTHEANGKYFIVILDVFGLENFGFNYMEQFNKMTKCSDIDMIREINGVDATSRQRRNKKLMSLPNDT